MDYIQINVNPQAASILCCKCGTSIEPNAANMCVACVRTEVDISEGIPKQCTLHFCKGCERYLQPPNQWIQCTLESRELLTLCLKKLKTLNRVRLVDATFAWTEPHSKRIKLKLTIQKEVLHGAILQQVFIVEFVVNSQMCEDCHRVEAKDFWRSVVQVRQKVLHKKTFYYLEQRILKHKAHVNALNIKANYDGLDFYFATKDHGRKLVDFLSTVAPCRYVTAQQLVSHDVHSNVFNYKTTFSVEIAPICKDDLVCLPLKLARSLGSINQLCICARVTNCIHLIDPKTGQTVEITSNQFWRDPFVSIGHTKQYSEYVVMNTETLMSDENKSFAGQGQVSRKHIIADAWVVKASELGINENYDHCRTHLGHLIKPGDSVLGFDLACANVNNSHFEKLKAESLPDAIIIKKVYADKELRQRKRKWMLKHLNDETAADSDEMHKDYVDFLEDLEEDPLYRKDVDVYKDPAKIGDESDYEDDTPRINLHEMLEDLHLDEPEGDGDDIDMTE